MTPPRVTLNGLERAGALLPGFIHAVTNHLTALAGHAELLALLPGLPPEAGPSLERIRQGTEGVRDEIEAVRARQSAAHGVEGLPPALPVPALADRLAAEFATHGWTVQRAGTVDRSAHGVRAEARWLAHAIAALVAAADGTPGLAVLQLTEGTPDGPGQFQIRLLHDALRGEDFAAAGKPAMNLARALLGALDGTLSAKFYPGAVAPLTLCLPLVLTFDL